jgi:hypothetical protein
VRTVRALWLIAALFVIACFFSGAWLGNVLSSIAPIIASRHATLVQQDEAKLRREERATAIATAIASPAAVLILFLTVLVASAMFTKDVAVASQHTSSSTGPRETE